MHTKADEEPPDQFRALYDHVVTCGRCGFCQSTCPVYLATGCEAYVARGKVALFRSIIEGSMDLEPDTKDAFSQCLLCRACTDSCFTAVRTDEVVISFRYVYAQRFGRSFFQRRVFRSMLPRPRLMRGLVSSLWAVRRTGLADAARRVGFVGLLSPKVERALDLRLDTPGPLLRARLAKRQNPASSGRPRVGYWMSCGYNYVLPRVGEATVRVLERMGATVDVLDNCCCGLAAHGYGDTEAAARLSRENLRRLGDLDRFDAIVSECGSCSGHLKEYPSILADDPEWSVRAEQLQSKTRSFSEFVVEQGGFASLLGEGIGGSESVPRLFVTYHDPCHLGRRYQNVVTQPRQLLESIPGVAFTELKESDSCCGAAGTYGVLHPETSAAVVDRKMHSVAASGASVVATECPACMMQLSFGVRRAQLNISVQNVSEVCDWALSEAKRLPRRGQEAE